MERLRVHPVILSGGSGTRLWPASRRAEPKQFLALVGAETMLQATARRVAPGPDGPDFAPLSVIGAARHEEATRTQLAAIGAAPAALILEPTARNTAPAAAAAAAVVARSEPEALVLLAPADHYMPDPAAFRAAVAAAAPAARDGTIVTFGVSPTSPHTGYGYIRAQGGAAVVKPVGEFREKPDRATAQSYLDSGDYLWNAGVFLFRADRLLEEMRQHEPAAAAAAEAAVARAVIDPPMVRLDAGAFAEAPDISIDYAVMERTRSAGVARLDTPWTDLGAWSAVWEHSPKDDAGNAVVGAAELVNARGVLAFSPGEDGPVISAIGVEDVVIIATKDAVLVSRRDQCEHVKGVVGALKHARRDDLL